MDLLVIPNFLYVNFIWQIYFNVKGCSVATGQEKDTNIERHTAEITCAAMKVIFTKQEWMTFIFG